MILLHHACPESGRPLIAVMGGGQVMEVSDLLVLLGLLRQGSTMDVVVVALHQRQLSTFTDVANSKLRGMQR